MAAIDNLTTALNDLTAAVSAGTAEITDLVNQIKGNPASDAAIQDAADKIEAQAKAMNDAVNAAKNPPTP